jgi:hypothetical protein
MLKWEATGGIADVEQWNNTRRRRPFRKHIPVYESSDVGAQLNVADGIVTV